MPSFQTEKAGVYGTAANLFGNVAQEMPFIGGVLDGGRVPISSALPNWENLGKAALSEDWSAKKRLATAAKELGTTAAYTLLPFGGTQLKRIWEGLQMAKQKGSYTVDKDGNQLLQYPLPSGNEWALALQAAVFGKTSLSTGREWIENGFGTLSADQTAAYQAIVDLGADTEEAYDLLVEIRSAERSDTQTKGELQREILRASGLSDECIGIVYYDVLASENEVSVMDELLAMDADMGAAARVLMDIKDAESSNDKRSAILMSGLSEDAKIEIYRYAISDERDEDIKAFRDSGLSFDDFLTAQNAHASIKEQYEDEGDMATAFARWVNQQGYTANQKTVIREKLKYWQMVPANSNQYDKGIAAGLTDEQAYELAENLGDLKPEDGKTQVSNVQKWREAVDLAWNTDSQIRTLKAVMDDNTYRKVEYMWDYGVAPAAYVRAQEVKSQYDADGNGNLTNKEWQAVVDAISSDSVLLPGGDNTIFYMDTAQKAILWQMLTGAESSRNNPYSSEWGEKVIQAKAEWNAARG